MWRTPEPAAATTDDSIASPAHATKARAAAGNKRAAAGARQAEQQQPAASSQAAALAQPSGPSRSAVPIQLAPAAARLHRGLRSPAKASTTTTTTTSATVQPLPQARPAPERMQTVTYADVHGRGAALPWRGGERISAAHSELLADLSVLLQHTAARACHMRDARLQAWHFTAARALRELHGQVTALHMAVAAGDAAAMQAALRQVQGQLDLCIALLDAPGSQFEGVRPHVVEVHASLAALAHALDELLGAQVAVEVAAAHAGPIPLQPPPPGAPAVAAVAASLQAAAQAEDRLQRLADGLEVAAAARQAGKKAWKPWCEVAAIMA